MNARAASLLIAINALVSAAWVGAYALWAAPPEAPQLAVLDIGELYRLKESQVTRVLMQRDASDQDRVLALNRAATFGAEVTRLLQLLPQECRCLILARGAVVGPAAHLPDLTPDVRRRLEL